jgi:hypothetical protein
MIYHVIYLAKSMVKIKQCDVLNYYSANTSLPTTKLANKVGSDVFLPLKTGDGQWRPLSWIVTADGSMVDSVDGVRDILE